MARARNIKPGFFKNEVLAELPVEVRLLFIGLWTLADREGRLEDRPKRIGAELFPFDRFDIDSMLSQLQENEFVVRYEAAGVRYIEVVNFVKHQDPHYKEKASEIPPPPGGDNLVRATGVTRTQRQRILERDGYACQSCGSVEHLCIDHVLPVSRGGDSSDENLQVLCLGCNTKKGNKLAGENKNLRRMPESIPAPDDIQINVGSNSGQCQSGSPSDSLNLIPDSPNTDSKKKQAARFARFWLAYPRKVSKPDAERAFKKLDPDDELLEVLLKAIEGARLTEQWLADGGKFIPHPATWLNKRRWEDEGVFVGTPKKTFEEMIAEGSDAAG